jgi:EmrB/QacA subfamily drug resistance transporter
MSCVATPILSRLGDQYGKKRLLAVSLGIFVASCVGASLAQNIATIVLFRLIQGASGAALPLSFAIVNDEFPRERAGGAIGMISATMSIGGGLGLPLSGVFVDHASWRWIFIVSGGVAALALALVLVAVPESPIKTRSRVDYTGAALLGTLLVSFLLALSEGDDWGWQSGRTLGLFAVTIVLLPVWIAVERRREDPLVDMRMLANRTVAFTNLASMLGGFGMLAGFVLLPQLAQMPTHLPPELARLVHYGFGLSATEAGLLMVPGAIIGILVAPFTGRMGLRFGYRALLVYGLATMAISGAALAAFHAAPWQVIVTQAAGGTGGTLIMAAMAKLVVDSVRPEETAVAAGMNSVMRILGGVIGGQVMGTLLTIDTIPNTNVPTSAAFTTGFAVAAGVSALAVLAAVRISPRRAPAEVAPVAAG